MTAEPDRITLSPSALARLVFVDTLEPLPLADPTEAALFLRVKRHTLACYRSLGDGPPYYKFGRWIRYAWPDLRQWAGDDNAHTARAVTKLDETTETSALVLVDATTAARFLAITRVCLYYYRVEGGGPQFCRFRRRIHYPLDGLLRWAEQQRHHGGFRTQSPPNT